MSINFPTSLDTFTNPTATDPRNNPSLAGQQSDQNDAIEALEAKVGADSSAVNTSHDYKLGEVTSGDKAVGKTATQTLINKTLTSPRIGTAINDTNGNELVQFTATGSAVNEVTLKNAATGNNPELSATGDDSNVGIDLLPKGTGTINIKGNATQAGTLRIYEDTDDGSNYTSIKVGAQSANVDYRLPLAQGTSLTVLQNDGSGNLSWAAVSGATIKTCIPKPEVASFASAAVGISSNTTLFVGLVDIPADITVNKISIDVRTVSVSGTLDIALFSEDGQTKVIDVTTGTISAGGVNTTSVSAVAVAAGKYYIAILPNSTANITVHSWGTDVGSFAFSGLYKDVTSEPIYQGTLTVTASTMPSTITPTSIAYSADTTIAFRLDN